MLTGLRKEEIKRAIQQKYHMDFVTIGFHSPDPQYPLFLKLPSIGEDGKLNVLSMSLREENLRTDEDLLWAIQRSADSHQASLKLIER